MALVYFTGILCVFVICLILIPQIVFWWLNHVILYFLEPHRSEKSPNTLLQPAMLSLIPLSLFLWYLYWTHLQWVTRLLLFSDGVQSNILEVQTSDTEWYGSCHREYNQLPESLHLWRSHKLVPVARNWRDRCDTFSVTDKTKPVGSILVM